MLVPPIQEPADFLHGLFQRAKVGVYVAGLQRMVTTFIDMKRYVILMAIVSE